MTFKPSIKKVAASKGNGGATIMAQKAHRGTPVKY
jgi:hypothetical protein